MLLHIRKGNMKKKPWAEGADANARSRFTKACLAGCQRILTQIKNVKDAIFAESRDTLKSQAHMLELALNEAEALAWQTKYPHLVFPTLATEKIQEVIAWNRHQRDVRR